jgi:hypothetical protein
MKVTSYPLFFNQKELHLKALCIHCVLFKNYITMISNLLYNLFYSVTSLFSDVLEFSGSPKEADVYLALEVSP